MNKYILCLCLTLCTTWTLSSQSTIAELEDILQTHIDSLGADHLDVAVHSDRLAHLYLRMGEFSKVEALFTRALDIRTNQSEGNELLIADSNYNLGRTNLYLGQFEKAKGFFEKSLVIRQEQLGKTHLDVADSYFGLGNASWVTSEFDDAEKFYQQALDIRLSTLDQSHLDVAACYHSLGIISWETGQYEQANTLYQKALDIRLPQLEETDRLLGESYNALGTLHADIGDFNNAINYLDKALQINIELSGESNLRVARDMNNLGSFYLNIGNVEKAKSLCEKALAIKLENYDEFNPDLARTYHNLGLIHLEMDDYEESIHYFNKSLNVKLKHFGEKDPAIIFDYNNLGLIYQEQGDSEKAIQYFNKALQKNLESFKNNLHGLAFTYNNLGLVHKDNGNYQSAIDYFNKALNINLANFDERHPEIVSSYTELASSYEQVGSYELADSIWHIFIPQNMHRLKSTYLFLPNEQRTQFANTFNKINTDFYSHATSYNSESTRQLATNYVLNTKSLALDYGVSTNQFIQEINDDALSQQLQELNDLNKQIADAELLTTEELESQGLDLIYLQDSYANLAYQMLNHPELKERLNNENIKWEELQNKLDPDEATIDFIRVYDKQEFQWMYYGIIIRKDFESPQYVRLTAEKTLELFLSHSQSSQPDYLSTDSKRKSLHNILWEPLSQHLEGITTVYLSPTSNLHRIAFESLQDETDKYLASTYEFHYYSALRDLLNEKTKESKFEDIVLMGHILYDPNDKSEYEERETSLSRGDLRRGVQPLSKTLDEVKEIRHIASLAGLATTMLTIDAATEDTVQYFVGEHAPSILHFATHGVFLTPNEKEISVDVESSRDRLQRAVNPLLRSALMFYGANDTWTKGQAIQGSSEDGILTGLEVTALDLQHTDMVVLSACATGLGDNHNTEGIFGLQRAFKLAGVNYIIASLWDVDDIATKDLMILFYDNLLQKSQSPATALRNAKLDMRNKGAQPKHWAGFILIE